MRTLRGVLLPVGVGALLLAGGCKSLSCSNPADYSSAQEVPPLKMPVGLDGPDTTQALEIPPLNEPEAPRDPKGACLEEPPVLDTTSAPAELLVPEQEDSPSGERGRLQRAPRGVTPRG
jgi:hypothetical protein